MKQAMDAGVAGYFVKANLSLQDLVKRGGAGGGARLMPASLVSDVELKGRSARAGAPVSAAAHTPFSPAREAVLAARSRGAR